MDNLDPVSKIHREVIDLQAEFHQHALRGDVVEVGGMDIAHNVEENNPHSEKSQRKKNEHYAEMLHVITQAQEAYDALIARLDTELEALRIVIEEIEHDIGQNRQVWEKHIEILEEIDEVLCDFEDGGKLDHARAKMVADKASIEVPNGLTDAQMITLLQEARQQTANKVDDLDAEFLVLEGDHKRARAMENEKLASREKLAVLDPDNLDAIEDLRQELGNKAFHRTATEVENEGVAEKADLGVDNDYNTNLDISTKLSIPGMSG